MSVTEPILEKLSQALLGESFIKLTLSQTRPGASGLKNLYARRVELKEGRQISLLYRYPTRDVTKNFPEAEAINQIGQVLENDLARAHLFTTTGDWQWISTSPTKLKASRPALTVAPTLEHDRQKPQPIDPKSAFLQKLGITNAVGEPRPGMGDKLRQIQRFVELLGHLVDDSPLRDRQQLRLLDMGAGKGALTFAACQFFQNRGVSVEGTGIELREELVKLTNRAVEDSNFPGLRFVQGSIASFPPAPLDLLIALHACDTATDDAIYSGIQSGASLIVTAPCCHKEIRGQLAPPSVLDPIVKHGIFCEREAEMLTDAIRALLLEIHGYKATVFEFISPEHTGKNVMIAASKRPSPLDVSGAREKLAELTRFYGITRQHLAQLLGEL